MSDGSAPHDGAGRKVAVFDVGELTDRDVSAAVARGDTIIALQRDPDDLMPLAFQSRVDFVIPLWAFGDDVTLLAALARLIAAIRAGEV